MEIVLRVNKQSVMNEVAKTTSYVGAHIDSETYDRVFTTDENEEMLVDFWNEAKQASAHLFSEYLLSSQEEQGEFVIKLSLPSNWKEEMKGAMQAGLQSFFVHSVVAGWFGITLKEEAASYVKKAEEQLDVLKIAMYERNRPKRRTAKK